MEPKGKRDISSLALGQNFRDIPQLVPPAGQKRENRFVPAKTETSAGIFVLDRLGHRTLLPALDTTNFPTDTFPRVGFLRISNFGQTHTTSSTCEFEHSFGKQHHRRLEHIWANTYGEPDTAASVGCQVVKQ